MKRIVSKHLLTWKEEKRRKPLLVRGARQVGKTHLVRELGKTFPSFVEINLEFERNAKSIFEQDLDPKRIMRDLALISGKKLTPGKTLLFLDEIQSVPSALNALRYFYENSPELHIIAAGSLLDFAIEEVGIPVGRVESLYLYPMSFFEFLIANEDFILAKEILVHDPKKQMVEVVHKKLLAKLAEYLACSGMPEAVQCWVEDKDPKKCIRIQQSLIDTYRQDFSKYAKKHQIKYVDLIFNEVPRLLGNRFKYTAIHGEYRKRELAPALDLLITAGIAHRVFHSDGQGVPLMAQIDPNCFKVLFLDTGLALAALGGIMSDWIFKPVQMLSNKGGIAEAFVGQEILAYAPCIAKASVFYWQRHSPGSSAEVDYLTARNQGVLPIEVKSGYGSTLKSLHLFLKSHPDCKSSVRFSVRNYHSDASMLSLPLYAVASLVADKKPLLELCTD